EVAVSVRKIVSRWGLVVTMGCVVGGTPEAQAQVVLWANGVVDDPFGRGPAVTGAPDGVNGGFGGGVHVTVDRFRGGFHPGLAGLLGVPDDVLATANVIAFEIQNIG